MRHDYWLYIIGFWFNMRPHFPNWGRKPEQAQQAGGKLQPDL